MYAINGTGVTFYGRDGRKEIFVTPLGGAEPELKEEVTVIKWVTFFWLPLIPLGRYRVLQEPRKDIISRIARHGWSSEKIRVLAKLPLSWPRVFLTYLKVYGVFFLWYFISLVFSMD